MTAVLVLASTSRYRIALLQRLGLSFEAVAPGFDEREHDHALASLGPAGLALLLARGKARSIAPVVVEGTPPVAAATSSSQESGAAAGPWVLAADQVAVLGEGDPPTWRQLHKPGTPAAAVEQLLQLSGREHRLVTGVVLRHAGTGVEHEAVDEVVLHMRAFGRAEAQAYVDAFAPLDCAGSYRIEDRGITLMRAIEAVGPCGADPTSIEGLPLLLTAQLLRRAHLLPA